MVLKALLGLVVPNQYCQGARMSCEAGFCMNFLARKTQISMIPNIQYCCTV